MNTTKRKYEKKRTGKLKIVAKNDSTRDTCFSRDTAHQSVAKPTYPNVTSLRQPVKVEFVDLRSCDKSIRRANRQTESVYKGVLAHIISVSQISF